MFSTFKFSENRAPIQSFTTKILNPGLIVAKCAILSISAVVVRGRGGSRGTCRVRGDRWHHGLMHGQTIRSC